MPENKQDRPDREEKIAQNIMNNCCMPWCDYYCYGWKQSGKICERTKNNTDQILALFDEEKIRKQIDALKEEITTLNKKLDDREVDLTEAKHEERERITNKLLGMFAYPEMVIPMNAELLLQALQEEK